jgi:hypothetical protein
MGCPRPGLWDRAVESYLSLLRRVRVEGGTYLEFALPQRENPNREIW